MTTLVRCTPPSSFLKAGLACVIAALAGCSGGGSDSESTPAPVETPTQTPSPERPNDPVASADRFDPEAYKTDTVQNGSLAGQWMLVGTQNITSVDKATGVSTTAEAKHRSVWAIRDAGGGSYDLRLCDTDATWTTQAIGDADSVDLDDFQLTINSNTAMGVTSQSFDEDDEESTEVSGTYKAYKIANDAERSLGTVELLASVIDYNQPNLPLTQVANNDLFQVRCFIETETSRQGQKIAQSLDFVFDTSDVHLLVVEENAGVPAGRMLTVDHAGTSYAGFPDAAGVTVSENTARKIHLTFDSENHLQESASGTIDLEL